MASVGTYIQYGNVKLFRVVTHEIRQQPVFDSSGTDLLYQKTTIRVSGYLHGHSEWSYLHNEPVATLGGVTGSHKLVRYQLPPRQRFLMAIGAVDDGNKGMEPGRAANQQQVILFEANPAPYSMKPPKVVQVSENNDVSQQTIPGNINLKNVDVANGPRCVDFSVTHITGNELFAVEATFELCKIECEPDGSVPDNTYGVLSNRWSVSDVLDANMRTIRTYQGVMVLASARINAQQLRWLVAPPLEPLFRRERMDFLWEADGLKLHWSITDEEIACSAPYPARKWSVQHTIRTERVMLGASSVSIQVEGDSNVNKSELIEICHWVIAAKMFRKTPLQALADPVERFKNAANQDVVIPYIVDSVEFTDHIGDVNMISASASVRTPMEAKDGVAMAFQKFGKPIEAADLPPPLDGTQGGLTIAGEKYKRQYSWGGYTTQTPAVEGPAQIIGIVSCFFQRPCTDYHALTGELAYDEPDLSAQPAVTPIPYTATTVTNLQTTQNSNATPYSQSHLTYPYMFWQVDNVFKTRGMRVQMPIAKAPASSSSPAKFQATSAFTRIAGGQTVRILRLSAERVGDWPEFPDPETLAAIPWPYPESADREIGWTQIKQTYLNHVIKPGRSTTTATGQVIFRASMEIRLGLSRPPTPKDKLALGNEKWTNKGQQVTTSTLTNSDWSQ